MSFKIRLGHGEVAISVDASVNNDVFIDFEQLFEEGHAIGESLAGKILPSELIGRMYFDNRNSFAQLRRSIDAAEILLTWITAQPENPTRKQIHAFMSDYVAKQEKDNA